MSLPRERPAFVLPWIVVILASFAALPALFDRAPGRLETAGDASSASGELVGSPQEIGPAQAPRPRLELMGPLGPGRRAANLGTPAAASFEELGEREVAQEATVTTPSEAGAVETPQPAEAGPSELPEESIRQPSSHSLMPQRQLTVAEASPTAARRPMRGAAGTSSSAGSPAGTSDGQAPVSRVRELADGRTELRLSPLAFAYLAGEGLIPQGAEILPAVAADEIEGVERTEAWDLDAEETVAAAGQRIAAERRRHLKRVRRLLHSDPARLVDFLARLTPGQMRALAKALRTRGITRDHLLGL